MQMNRNRLALVSGTTLALVIASTASVAAFGPRDDDRGSGPGDRLEHRMDGMGGMGGPGAMRGQLRDGLGAWMGGAPDDFERREVTLQTADGISSRRVEQGVVDAATDASLTFTLGSGEAVSVTLGDDTQVVAFSEQTIERRGWSRQRMVPTEVTPADIEMGAQVMVWSESEDGADFVAQRIVIQPAADETTSDAAETPAEEPAGDAGATEDTSAAARHRRVAAAPFASAHARPPGPVPGGRSFMCAAAGVLRAGELERGDVIGQLEAEDLGVERQLCLQRAPLVGGLAEPVALPLEEDVGMRQAVLRQRRHDAFGL